MAVSLPTTAVTQPERPSAAAAALEALYPGPSLPRAWQAILAHYRLSTDPVRALGSESTWDGDAATLPVRSDEHLLEAAAQWGLDTEQTTVEWHQLFQQEFPFLLLTQPDQGYWIVGREGACLQAEWNGQRHTLHQLNRDRTQREFRCVWFTPTGQARPVAASQQEATFSIRWFLGLYRKNSFTTAQLIMASILVQCFGLGMPLFYMIIFDRVFGRQNLATLDVMALGLGLLLIFDLLVKQVRGYVLDFLLKQLDKQLADRFLDKVFSVNLQTASTEKMRGLADLFAALTQVNHAIANTFLVTSLDLVFSSIIVAVLFALDPVLASVAVAPIVPMGLLFLWYLPTIKKRQASYDTEQRQYRLRLSEALDNVETLKAVDAERQFKREIKDQFREHVLTQSGAPRSDRTNLANMQLFVAAVGMLALLYVGAHRVLSTDISFGVYLAINMLSRTVMAAAQKLFENVAQFQESYHTLHQIKSFYEDSQEESVQPNGIYLDQVQGSIEFNAVSFRYGPELPLVLKDLTFTLQPGEKIILTGRSGSGKTTLLRLLQRLYVPEAGYILLDGYNVADMELSNLREHVGVAIQRPALFSGTMRENIALGKPQATLKEIVSAATMAQLDQFLLSHPDGFNMPVLHKGVNLSGGQAARVSLARTFLKKPSVLALDEALNALEPTLKAAVLQQVWRVFAKKTCIFITDFIQAHQKADRILVLHDGQVVEQGTFEELLTKQGYYYHLHRFQLPLVGRTGS